MERDIVVHIRPQATLRPLVQYKTPQQIAVTLHDGATVQDALDLLHLAQNNIKIEINSRLVEADAHLTDGDEVDLIPAIFKGH